MEISIPTIRCSASSICHTPSNSTFDLHQYRHRATKNCPSITTLQCNGSRRIIRRGEVRILAKNSLIAESPDSNDTIWEESGVVEVIGIGSRVDSVLDYCLNASSSSRSLRFWNIVIADSARGKLRQRLLGTDKNPDLTEAPLHPQSFHKAVVLVATAGYDDYDHATAIDVMKNIRSVNGLVVTIILRPFDFEGRRRQNEVKILLQKIQECTNFCIEIDINSLLKMDLVTLDEALRTANRAVFLGISTVAVLISGLHRKHIDSPYNQLKELDVPGIVKVLESYKEGAIGFGMGHNFETSILQAACHCPFLSLRLKDLDGLVICILSSGNVDDCNAVPRIMHTFRRLTECERDVMISVVYDPDLQPNVIATTVITVSSHKQKLLKKSSLLSKLVEHIPFFFDFLRDSRPQLDSHQPSYNAKESSSLPTFGNPLINEVLDKVHVSTPFEGFEIHSSELQRFPAESSSDVHVFSVREFDNVASHETSEGQHSDLNPETSSYYKETIAFQRELLLSRDMGLTSKTEHDLTKDGAITGVSTGFDKPSIFQLPVGVRPSSHGEYSSDISTGRLDPQSKTKDHTTGEALAIPNGSSRSGMTDVLASLNGKYADRYKKQGVLSARAASMLDAERDSEKKWNRVLEIGYKGGTYKGHCQGGLPEGRGRLQFPDGSAYDGMWRYGKRSGLGTFCFSNGDVFQGTWRDDLMHGKGWFYFHNGDRWFSNFWKGQANGEGRFYSKSGEVFYGHFQDGWRHGRFQCVKHDGTRFVEIWEDGFLLRREQLDFESSSGSDDENTIQ